MNHVSPEVLKCFQVEVPLTQVQKWKYSQSYTQQTPNFLSCPDEFMKQCGQATQLTYKQETDVFLKLQVTVITAYQFETKENKKNMNPIPPESHSDTQKNLHAKLGMQRRCYMS